MLTLYCLRTLTQYFSFKCLAKYPGFGTTRQFSIRPKCFLLLPLRPLDSMVTLSPSIPFTKPISVHKPPLPLFISTIVHPVSKGIDPNSWLKRTSGYCMVSPRETVWARGHIPPSKSCGFTVESAICHTHTHIVSVSLFSIDVCSCNCLLLLFSALLAVVKFICD